MPTPAYPVTIPGPSRVSFRPGLQLVASDSSELGPIAVRRRSRQPTADAQVTFRYLEDDYATFVAWWRTDLLFGHRWFTLALPSASGLVAHVVRFAKKYSAQAQGHRYIEVSCDLELRERKIGSAIYIDPFVPEVYTFDMPINTYCAAAFSYGLAYVLNGLDAAATYQITTPPGRTFQSWSGYPSDSVALPWIWLCYVRGDNDGSGGSGFTDWVYGGVSGSPYSATTAEGARLLQPNNAFITGYTRYYFYFIDPNPGDNRGGMSYTVTELPP